MYCAGYQSKFLACLQGHRLDVDREPKQGALLSTDSREECGLPSGTNSCASNLAKQLNGRKGDRVRVCEKKDCEDWIYGMLCRGNYRKYEVRPAQRQREESETKKMQLHTERSFPREREPWFSIFGEPKWTFYQPKNTQAKKTQGQHRTSRVPVISL